MKRRVFLIFFFTASLFQLMGQGPGPGFPPQGPPPDRKGGPPGSRGGGSGREHTATQSKPLKLVPADEQAPAGSQVMIREQGNERKIKANGMPDHLIGQFPNRGNPNPVREQSFDIVIPANPVEASKITLLQGPQARPPIHVFGVTLDGVYLEPGTGEFWMGRRESGWNYEALGGAVSLGLDANYAHVQPDGNYHYHGLPIGLMRRLGHEKGEHSPMIGWAADGFPIYALFGFSDPGDPNSKVVELTSSHVLKEGRRPGGSDAPGGEHDGAFFEDYEFVPGSGDLDECNGRFCVTPEFPGGTYAYFLTRDWPVIPRAFRGTPASLKEVGRHRGGGPGGQRPPGERPPPNGRPPRPF